MGLFADPPSTPSSILVLEESEKIEKLKNSLSLVVVGLGRHANPLPNIEALNNDVESSVWERKRIMQWNEGKQSPEIPFLKQSI